MEQTQRVKEFQEKYQALCKEYQLEIRPQVGINLFDISPEEEVVEKVEESGVEESPKEAEVEETSEKQA